MGSILSARPSLSMISLVSLLFLVLHGSAARGAPTYIIPPVNPLPRIDVSVDGHPLVTTGEEPLLTTGGQPTVTTGGDILVTSGGQPRVTTGGETLVITGGQPTRASIIMPLLSTPTEPNTVQLMAHVEYPDGTIDPNGAEFALVLDEAGTDFQANGGLVTADGSVTASTIPVLEGIVVAVRSVSLPVVARFLRIQIGELEYPPIQPPKPL